MNKEIEEMRRVIGNGFQDGFYAATLTDYKTTVLVTKESVEQYKAEKKKFREECKNNDKRRKLKKEI